MLSFAYPRLGRREIAKITTAEVLDVLLRLDRRGRHESARKLRSVIGRIFRYAIATQRAEHDLTANLKEALTVPKVRHYSAITNSQEVGPLLRAIDGLSAHKVTHCALRLAPHIFLRPGELRRGEWCEIDFENAVWSIAAEKMKMGRPHRVPLSRQAVGILREAQAISGSEQYIFPGYQSLTRPMCENTLNAALRRLGYSSNEMTSHGFRAMASTLLNEMGKWHPDAIERQLAHTDSNSVRRAYARGEYWLERVQMMQHWSDYLDDLRAGRSVNFAEEHRF